MRRLSWRRLTRGQPLKLKKLLGRAIFILKRCFIQQNTLRFRSSAMAREWSTYGTESAVCSVNGRNWSRLLLRLGYPMRLERRCLSRRNESLLQLIMKVSGPLNFWLALMIKVLTALFLWKRTRDCKLSIRLPKRSRD